MALLPKTLVCSSAIVVGTKRLPVLWKGVQFPSSVHSRKCFFARITVISAKIKNLLQCFMRRNIKYLILAYWKIFENGKFSLTCSYMESGVPVRYAIVEANGFFSFNIDPWLWTKPEREKRSGNVDEEKGAKSFFLLLPQTFWEEKKDGSCSLWCGVFYFSQLPFSTKVKKHLQTFWIENFISMSK